jgi:hypothetical protein
MDACLCKDELSEVNGLMFIRAMPLLFRRAGSTTRTGMVVVHPMMTDSAPRANIPNQNLLFFIKHSFAFRARVAIFYKHPIWMFPFHLVGADVELLNAIWYVLLPPLEYGQTLI